MTTVTELVTRVNDLKKRVDDASGAQTTSSDKLNSTQTDIEGKAESAKPCPTEASGYKTRAEAAKPKVTAIPGINDIAKELHKFAVPEPDFCLSLVSNLDLERGFGNVTFTRSTTGTYVDKTGVLRTAKANEPRFEKEGILIEGSSANLVYTSESGGWGCDIDSVTSREGSGFGSFKSRILLNNGKGLLGRATKNYTYSDLKPGDKITASVWIRNIGGTNTLVWLYYGKTDSSGNSMSSQVTVPAKNTQWTRYTITETVQPGNKIFQLQVRNQNAYEVEVACPQVEALPFASSYIPTEGVAVTRGFDDLRILEDGGYSPATISFYNDIKARADIYTNFMSFSVIGALPRVESNSNSRIAFAGRDASTDVQYYLTRNNMTWNGSLLAAVFDNGRSDFYENGIRIASTQQTNKQYSKGIYIGLPSSSRPGVIHLRNFRIWHTALTDDQIAML